MISVRRIRPGEGQLFRELRLAALNESPLAFSSSYESASQRSYESWREQADASAAGSERATFIAFAGGSPVGIGAVYRDKDRRDEGEVLQVWVAPGFRGGEVAGELMAALLAWCEENGIRQVSAAVATGNDRALTFYAKHGFTAGGFTAGGFTAGGFTAGGFTAGGFAAGGFAATGPATCGASGGTVLGRTVGNVSGE